jgi:predicted NBD/HSP70 family sugar kinase
MTAVRDGDRAAVAALRHAGDVLGRGISMLLNLIGPSHVIVFGPPPRTNTAQGIRSAEIFMRAVDRSVGSNSFSFAAKRYKLLNKLLHAGLGAVGAASAVLGRVIPRSVNG